METKFDKVTFFKRLKSMLSVDIKRMFTTRLFYIILGISIVIPVLILVMTTMMDGTTTTDPNTGAVTTIEGFDYVWQAIAKSSKEETSMSMDLTTMCNINMLYFLIAVLVCIFVADDFRSGFSKNLFAMRSKKTDYVISKTIVCFIAGALLLVGYFLGAMLGGAISSLSFEIVGGSIASVIMCMLSKILLVLVFVPIFLVMSLVGKERLWLSILLALGVSMLLFNIVPMVSPLDSTIMNVVLSLAGGVLFSIGIGAISNLVLKKTSLV